MDKEIAYKFGFLLKCAEEGMEASEALNLYTNIKIANTGSALSAIPNTGITALKLLLGVGIPLSGGIGLTGGYLWGKSSRKPEADTEVDRLKAKMKNEELALLYKIEAEKALRKAKLKQYRASRPAPPRQLQLF